MPDLHFADMVRETSTSTGTAAFVLDGATPGHRRFADAVPAGARFHYAIAGVTHEDQWEVGEGELAGGALVGRDVLASSAGSERVDFSPGLKIVTLTVGSAWFAAREDRAAHSHSSEQITGLQAALDGKQPLGSYASAEHGHGGLALAAGSAANPALGFAADADTGVFLAGPGMLAVTTEGSERARFTDSGEIGLGTISPAGGLHISWDAFDPAANTNSALIVEGSYGGGVLLKDGAGFVGLWSTDFGETFNIGLGPAGLAPMLQITGGTMRPYLDAVPSLGSAAKRWSQLYAASGTINTSDERAKHWQGVPDPQEIAAGRALIAELGFFQWRDARAAKGPDAARRHFGLRAQRAFAIMEAHGLDWRRYGWCCHDAWEDEDGAHERYGIRSDQLALFLIAVLAQQLAAPAPGDIAGAAG